MKIAPFAFLLLLHPISASSQESPSPSGAPVPPEIVRLEKVQVEDELKNVRVGNSKRSYLLYCNVKADGCMTPEPDKNYLLFDKNTRWKMPGATNFLTLAFMQDWKVKYNQGENIGLIPEKNDGDFGVFILDETGGGYEQDTVFSDGPIIYGTGMSDADRQKAWKHFFLQMVEAVARQQGKDALGVKLAKRCLPGQDVCTIALDANFVGIGGIQEPRKVVVLVVTDIHDQNKQLARLVCTRPANGKQVCREWDTGKLVD